MILITLLIQGYWNYQNYVSGKQRLMTELQNSLDKAVDTYFIERAESSVKELLVDRNGKVQGNTAEIDPGRLKKISLVSNKKDTNLAGRVILSLKTDSLEMEIFNAFLLEELCARDLEVEQAFLFQNKEGKEQVSNAGFLPEAVHSTTARSPYLPEKSILRFYYGPLTQNVLERNFGGILLSGLLITAVVACLFFLLKIISRQKHLSEIREDLLSNLTHEFKTPISTVKVALEAIGNFNNKDDFQKTRNYVQIADAHLERLEFMVDKLMETATLKKDSLELNFEKVDVVSLMAGLVEDHRRLTLKKSIKMISEKDHIWIQADAFYLKNALNNVLDNAVNYGGNAIEVNIHDGGELIKIGISDNGKDLTASQARHIFEKFYRVPKGNVHDVKGHGIGLYYSRQIVGLHGGNIDVNTHRNTQFLITLPNG